MAKALVKADIHILLFTLLYREEEEEEDSMKNGTMAAATRLEDSSIYSPPYDDEQKDKVKECECLEGIGHSRMVCMEHGRAEWVWCMVQNRADQNEWCMVRNRAEQNG